METLSSVKSIDKEIAKIDSLIDSHAGKMVAAAAEHRQAVEDWEQRGRETYALGGDFAEAKPLEPDTLRLANQFLVDLRHQREVAVRDRLKRIATASDEVLQKATAQVEKAMSKARPLVRDLESCVAEIRAAQVDLQTVRQATNAVSTDGILVTGETRLVDVAALAEAVNHDVDLLRSSRPPRSLGMTMESVPVQTTAWEPPRPHVDVPTQGDDRALLQAAKNKQSDSLRKVRPLGYRYGDRLM